MGEDAEKVAAYIYEAFYSKAAQARNPFRPARIELSRLTVRQYRNAVADLIGSFRDAGRWDDRAGSRRSTRGPARRRRGGGGGSDLNRVDPEVRFDFGTDSPIPEQNAVKELSRRYVRLPVLLVPVNAVPAVLAEFRVNWQGSVLAPETGEYEFIVRTENAMRLWVNDTIRPLIDAWVKSGNDTEYRESIFLLGGRVYPLRLEFSSQGRRRRRSSVGVCSWKLPAPGRRGDPAAEPLARPRSRRPSSLTTPFPPDDRSVGYERGTSISKAWDQATTDAAIEVAGYVVGPPQGAGRGRRRRRDKDRESEAPRVLPAVRRAGVPAAAVGRAEGVLHRSPVPGRAATRRRPSSGSCCWSSSRRGSSIARSARGSPDAYDVASRLSFGLWDSLPDQPLREAAAAGRLASREQVADQAERMVADLRARSKLREFFLQWLKVDQGARARQGPQAVPRLRRGGRLRPADLARAVPRRRHRQRVRRFPPAAAARTTSISTAGWRSSTAPICPPDAPFQKVDRTPGERAGVLTHPYLMASFAYTATSSPIHRGVFLVPERAGPGAAAAAGGRRPAGRRPPPRPDDPRARRRSRPGPSPASPATG